MADDLGYGDLGCYDNENILTPHLDKLAKNGIRFIDFHSNGAVCSPTRAALMTGLYQQRVGIQGVVTAKNHRHTGLSNKAFTIADFLKQQDYKTGIIGKWHLGYDTLYSPLNNGFDYFKGFVSGNIDYHSHIDQEAHYDWWLGKDTLVEEGYSTDLITQSSIAFIDANKQHPFFLYVAHESPHYPFQARQDSADRTVGGKFIVQGSRQDKAVAYKEMIEIMDEGIGQLFAALEQQKLLENTLIFFCSDNGPAAVGSSGSFKGKKGSLWEGGHRVPAIAYWKDKIQPSVRKEPLMTMDIFPTIVDLVNPVAERLVTDGQSFLPLLFSNPGIGSFPERVIFWRFKNQTAVRQDEWKLVKTADELALFNLKKDPSEKHNLISDHPDKKKHLMEQLEQWESEMAQYELRTN